MVVVACSYYFYSGWVTTLLTFMLDAAGQDHSDWVKITSPTEQLSIADRSLTLFVAGVIAASACVFFGNLSGFIGRIPVVQGSVIVGACAIIGFAFARQKFMLIMLVFVSQWDAGFIPVQLLLAEWLPVHWRGFLIIFVKAFWNVGRFGLTLLWTILPPSEQWVTFFLAASLFPAVLAIVLAVCGHNYESPRWLAVVGSMEKCITALKMAAASQPAGSPVLPDGWDEKDNLQLEGDAGQAVQGGQLTAWSQLGDLRESKLQFTIVVLGFCFFSVNFAWSTQFYWLMEYLRKLGAEDAIVPVMMVAPVGKLVCIVILLAPFVPGRCIADKAPRSLLMKLGFFGTALCVALLCYTTSVTALTVIVFCHNVLEGLIWTMGAVYANEAFPTTARSSALGVVYCIGNVGGFASASIAGELMKLWVYLPMAVASTLLFAGGCSCFLLTDERGSSPLVDTNCYGTCDGKSP